MRVNWINVDEKAKPAVAARRAKTNPSTPQHNGYRIAHITTRTGFPTRLPRWRRDCRFFPLSMRPVLLGRPLVCTIRFNQRARTVITHTNIARRISWPKANNEVIASRRNQKKKRSKQLLQRRAKRGQRPGGNRRSDQAKRSRNKQLLRRS